MDLTAAQTPGGASSGAMDSDDWQTQLPSGSRGRIVNKISKEMKRCILVSGKDGEQEFMKIAVKFEEKVYNAATSQEDYMRNITVKMLTMDIKSSKDDVVEEVVVKKSKSMTLLDTTKMSMLEKMRNLSSKEAIRRPSVYSIKRNEIGRWISHQRER